MLSGGTDGAGDNVLLVVIIFSLFPFLFVVEWGHCFRWNVHTQIVFNCLYYNIWRCRILNILEKSLDFLQVFSGAFRT